MPACKRFSSEMLVVLSAEGRIPTCCCLLGDATCFGLTCVKGYGEVDPCEADLSHLPAAPLCTLSCQVPVWCGGRVKGKHNKRGWRPYHVELDQFLICIIVHQRPLHTDALAGFFCRCLRLWVIG